MRIASWKTAGLIFIGLLGIGIVVSSTAAEAEQRKPPPRRVVQHPRVAPRVFAVPGRLPLQQGAGPHLAPGNFPQRGGYGQAYGRPQVGPGTGNPSASVPNGPYGRGFAPGTNSQSVSLPRGPNGNPSGPPIRQSMAVPGSLPRATGTPGLTHALPGFSGQTRPGQFGNRGFGNGFANRGFGNGFGNRGFGNGFGNRGFGNRGFGNGFGNRGFGNRGFVGGLANRGRGGNGAPPGTRLIDMRVMPLPPGSGLPPIGETRFRTNQVVLQFGADRTPQQVAALAQRFGLTIVAQQTIGVLRRTVYTFRINNGQPVDQVIRQIDGAGVNAAAQPNYTYNLMEDQDGADAVAGDPAQYIVRKLDLDAVHKITEGNDVVVALIDSQVDLRQPDLADRIVDSYDAGCGADTPPDAHGTGMAGAIASHAGLLGVAPDAKIMAICAFGGTGTPEATSAKIIRGLDYAIQHGAKIVNMSFAGPSDPALAQELQIAREKGILVIAAAGNAGPNSPPLYPGADPNVMAVTATDMHDHLFAGANQGSYVAVAAPGVNILVPAPNGGAQFTTGTSVATANVSGVAALLIAEDPKRTPEDVRAILVSTAKHLGAPGVNPQFGAGLVDPLKALHAPPEVAAQTPANDAPADATAQMPAEAAPAVAAH